MLDAAEELVVATRLGKGFTTNALARKGILSVGAIHKHVGSREEIIRKLLQRQEARLRAALAVVATDNKASLIKGHASALVALVATNTQLAELLELERRRVADPSMPGLVPGLTSSFTFELSKPHVPVRKPVTIMSQVLAEMTVCLAFQARAVELPPQRAVEGILKAALVIVDDANW